MDSRPSYGVALKESLRALAKSSGLAAHRMRAPTNADYTLPLPLSWLPLSVVRLVDADVHSPVDCQP
jgi:hypothetical protein